MPADDYPFTPTSARYRSCLSQAFFDPNWVAGCQAIATGQLWRFCLLVIGSASSIIYPHVPLVSFAAVAGTTLNRWQAVVIAGLIWLTNQLYSYTIRHYPLSVVSCLWGLTMGLGTIVVVLIASIQPKFSRHSWWGQGFWLGIALLLGFCVYQSSILLVNQWVGMHGLTTEVMMRIFVQDLIWAIALFSLHSVLVLNHQRVLRRSLR